MEFLTPEEMRDLEVRATRQGLTISALMENAGRAVAQVIGETYRSLRGPESDLLVVCGTENNGGDGFVAARYLSREWRVRVLLLGASPSMIKTQEARENFERLSKEPIEWALCDTQALALRRAWFDEAIIIVDAVFGTGVRGEVREPMRTAIGMINAANGIKVAIDVPSGLDPETGSVPAGDIVRADLTVALHRPKTGLKGREAYTGKIVAVPIGLSEGRPVGVAG